MKYRYEVVARVRYVGEVDLTAPKYKILMAKLGVARGYEAEEVAQDFLESAGVNIADPSDWGDYEIQTLEPIAESSVSERG